MPRKFLAPSVSCYLRYAQLEESIVIFYRRGTPGCFDIRPGAHDVVAGALYDGGGERVHFFRAPAAVVVVGVRSKARRAMLINVVLACFGRSLACLAGAAPLGRCRLSAGPASTKKEIIANDAGSAARAVRIKRPGRYNLSGIA